MPKQNRPLVRDGRLQPKKKRTDRSYLRPGREGAVAPTREEAVEPAEDLSPEAPLEEEVAMAEPAAAAPVARQRPAVPQRPAARTASIPAAPAPRPGSGRLPTAVRAIQQQGVRKRREFDVNALAVRDTQYAIHELRRIAVLATMIVVTLIVLGFVLR